RVRTTGFFYGSTNGTGAELPHPLWLDLREQSHVFSGVFGVSKFSAAVNDGDGTSVAHGELVTGTYFPVLGVGTARGRLLGREDDRAAGAHPVAVVSHAYWQRVLGADPQVVGRTLRIAGTPLTIVGVTAPGFDGASVDTAAQIFVPMAMRGAVTRSSDQLTDRRARWLNVFARLQPGVTAEQATSALQPWYRAVRQQELLESGFARASSQVRQRFLDENRLQVLPAPEGHTPARDELRRPLWILMGVVGGVLLIACANLANLLLARGAVRQREIALRLSLGATRARVIRQLLVETLLLALLGGAAGLVVAWGGAHLLLQFFVNADGPTLIHATPDVRILAFTLLMSVGTGVLFGMAPALQATNPALAPTLKSEAGSVLGGSRQGLRRALVVSQVALSLVLLTGAGLFLRSLDGLLSMNLGFSPERLLMFGADAAQAGYDSVRTKQFATELLDRVRATPGVEAAGFSSVPLLWDAWWGNSITIEGYVPADGEDPGSRCNAVSPGYFAALGIDLLSGRDFTDGDFRVPPSDMSGRDASGGYRVAIASESFVRRYITGNPIGRHIGLGNDPGTATPIEIIGVVKDSTYSGPREERQHQLYFPYLEGIEAGMPWFYVRAQRDPALLLPAMRQVVRGLNADVPVHALRTLDEQLARSVINQRLITTLSGVFGALATLLAMVGLYGVVAYTVTRRTR
ncbi:MAG TPA: ABC transporter permease, partial [Luteitalea sp.]|nr:ABC transporter permease [Luteitalea sp.]